MPAFIYGFKMVYQVKKKQYWEQQSPKQKVWERGLFDYIGNENEEREIQA